MVVTTVQCDKCGEIIPDDQQTAGKITINDKEYDFCPFCYGEALAGLENKGRSTPESSKVTITLPTPWYPNGTGVYPIYPSYPICPSYPDIGTGARWIPNPAVVWCVGSGNQL